MDSSRLNRFINQRLADLPLEEPSLVTTKTPVSEALSQMREGNRSCVIAMEDGRLAGIFTERDIVMRCMDDGFDWNQPIGGSVLTQPAQTIRSSGSVAEAIAMMQQHHYRTLPVADGDRVVGLIRVGDLLRHLAEAFPEDVLNLPPRPHQVMEKEEGG